MQDNPIWTLPPRKQRSRLAEDLVVKISQHMRDGTLKRGEKLPAELDIMRAEGVSRTVVRDALSRLQVAGLVETRRGVGTFVCDMPAAPELQLGPATISTAQDVLELLELRMSLEVATVGLAAQRRTPVSLKEIRVALDALQQGTVQLPAGLPISADFQFHIKIAKAAQNSHLLDIMKHLGAKQIPRNKFNSAYKAHEDGEAYKDNLSIEHEMIYESIARGDVDCARAAMQLHLINSRERLLKAQRRG
ncbi:MULTISPECIES: FadR/GntR family transcriptional regulator [Pseudomonas]|uniref:GntR family transcriptional regulator n=1 Tax=Pseudomonas fulva TaxID=47880 RepID=A0A0D0J6S4_9PSED|nr:MULTISPECIES: FadR/GntR family transcriptional regulator [Pseudomonas]KIQ01373.1 GntR family transcriptional regulator [Pseudomonas fulva]